MKGFVPLDPESNVSQLRFAVVYTKRKSRKRFLTTIIIFQPMCLGLPSPQKGSISIILNVGFKGSFV
jgi:hypothetical protein